MVDSSLAVGELNQSTYPDSVSIMALFKVSSGPDKYNVKLFQMKNTCKVACISCEEGNTVTCTQCKSKYIDYLSACTLCPASDPNKAIVVENGSPVCVDTASDPYKSGYRSVTGQSFRLIEKCTVANCAQCSANKDACTACKTDYIFYMSVCTLCPASDANNGIVVENGSPVCIDRTSDSYKTGYGLVTSQSFRLIVNCALPNCAECIANKDSCTACKTDYAFYMSVCTLCPVSDPNNAIVVENGSPVCVDRTSDPYKAGFGLVTGQSFRLLEACTVSDCRVCSEQKDTCTGCKEGFALHLNKCTKCDTPADPNKAIVVESNTPQCVSTDVGPHSSGYRVVSSDPFKLIEVCTVTDCSTCPDVKSTCTACKSGFALYLEKCTECDPAKAIVVQQGEPVCMDFGAGYRVVFTDPFRLIEACTVAGCSTCPDIKSTCTACKTGFALYQNKCTECDPAKAILIQDGLPVCVDHKQSPYNSGYRQDTTVTDFQLIEACTVTDCDTCPALKSTCTACKSDHILHLQKCTLCDASPESKFAIYVKDSDSPECVATDSGPYSSGFGLDTSISTFRLIDKCSIFDCESCAANKNICTDCKTDHVFHLNKCTLCPQSDPSKAIVVLADGSPKCVDVSSTPYSTGYRVDTSVTAFKLIEACKVPNCSACPASVSICTACATSYVLSADSLSCISSTPQPSAQPQVVSKAAFTVRHDSPRNSIAIFHNQGSSVQMTKVVAVDLDSGKTYSCEQIGCRHSVNAEKITFTFDSQIQILQGELHINIQSSNSGHISRRLQSQASEITVTEFVLLKSNALSAWVTTLQVLIWLLRTVGCIWLFPSHPRIAMLPDYTVTLCAVLSVMLGPVIPGSDTVIQAIGQVKILWYWFANPFIAWDRHTESCNTRPGHGLAGVYCSFLDNYGQNTIGLFAVLALILLLDCGCRVVISRQKVGGRTLSLLHNYQQNFGLKFWFAKMQANQLEILMYVLISYSLADSSSKSVVGLVLASLHLAFMIGTATMATGLNFQAAKQAAQAGKTAASTTPERSLTAARHLLEPSLCKVSEIAHHKATGAWPAVHLARDLAFSILVLNNISDPVTLSLVVAAVQLCYTGYQGVFRYHGLVLEHIGGLAIDGTFLIILLLKAIAASIKLSAVTRVDILSPLLICVLGLIFLMIIVLGVLTFFIKQAQPARLKATAPVKLQIATTEGDDLLGQKKIDHHQREQLYNLPKFDEEIDMPNHEFSIPEENPGIEHSPQGIHISEASLKIPNEFPGPHTQV